MNDKSVGALNREQNQHPECPFVVGERYKNEGGDVYRFIAVVDDAQENSRAVFLREGNGEVVTRSIDGSTTLKCLHILPEPLPRVMYANKYTIGESGSEVWYLYKDKAHAEDVSGNYPPGKVYAIAEPVEVPRG